MSTSLTEIRTPAIAAEDRPPRRASAAERRARQQAIVARLGLRALEGEAAPALMDRAVDGLREGLDVEFAEVLQLLPDGDRLLLRAGAGWRDGLVGRATVSGGTESQAGFTIQAGEPVILQDLRRETRFRGPPLLLEHGVVSGLSVVIPGRGRPYGVLGAHTARRRRFSHHDAHFVQAAANVLAGAIERERGERELRESERRYRTLLERANDAIFVYPLDPEGRPGRYSEVNEVACRRLGYSREELLRLSPAEVVDRGDEPYALVLHRLREGGSVVFERHQIAKDGRRIPVEISATLLELGGGPAVVAIARDVTERKRAEAALRESEERLRFTIEAARVGTWDWDMTTGHVRWSDNLEAIHGLPPGSFGGDFESVLADVHPDDRDRVMEAVQRTAEGGDGHYHVEYRLPAREGVGERWVEGKGRTIRDPETGRPVRMAGICMDVTERKRAERTLELLVGELQHRVKNVLAVVQSLAAQTLRTAGSPEAFSEAFQGRLAGLAEAHRLLAGTNWEGTGLRELVMAELAPWQQDGRGGDDRIRLAGGAVTLAPKAALTLGMAFHELATNAVKYGALSAEAGRIEVSWRVEDDGPRRERRLALSWREHGGPAVRAPRRRGFGTRFIEHALAYELQGSAALEFRPRGLCCELTFPLPAAAAPRDAAAGAAAFDPAVPAAAEPPPGRGPAPATAGTDRAPRRRRPA